MELLGVRISFYVWQHLGLLSVSATKTVFQGLNYLVPPRRGLSRGSQDRHGFVRQYNLEGG